jgi:tRNA A37 threonylcarbamoyladenosine dehydratase
MELASVDVERRFSGVRRLYGEVGLAKLQTAHVIVVGIGGVGSWAAEALARNAIGKLTLIDLDNIAESNFNRQIHALEDNLGKAKVTAMRERIMQINPLCQVHEIEDFVSTENVGDALGANIHAGGGTVVLDATDDVKAKVAMVAYCKANCLNLVLAGAAGGRLDPTQVMVEDLAYVSGDRLLAKVRNQLRKDHGFAKGVDSVQASKKSKQTKFGLLAVFSNEPVIKPDAVCDVASDNANDAITGLNCAGYGSAVSVTATFGFVAAQTVLNLILKK